MVNTPVRQLLVVRDRRPLMLSCLVLFAVTLGGCAPDGAEEANRIPAPTVTWLPPSTSASDSETPAPVARVNGVPIDANAVRTEMVRRGADFLSRFKRIEEKEGVVEALVRVQVLAQKARDEGFMERPSVREAIDRVLAEHFWREQVSRLDMEPLTPEAIRAEYDANPDRYTEDLRVRGALLQLRSPSSASHKEREALRTRAAALRVEAVAADEAGFAALVRAHSDDLNTRERGGDMGFIAEGASVFRFEREVIDALFAISEPDGTSDLVETERGFAIVRQTATHGGKLAPYEAVAPDIHRRLAEQYRRDALEARYVELRGDFDVELDRELLATLGPRDLAASERPPSFPAGNGL